MIAKYTPGPWQIHPRGWGDVVAKDGSEICLSHDQSDFPEVTLDMRSLGRLPRADEAEANARLIAAAPTMVEALQQAEQQIDYGQHDAALRIIRAALAAAGLAQEGEA